MKQRSGCCWCAVVPTLNLQLLLELLELRSFAELQSAANAHASLQ